MYTSSSSVYAVNYQARALCPQRAATEKNRFIVGTCSLHDSNEISILEYHEDSNQIDSVALFSHPDQISSMESSPNDPSLLLTCRQPKDGRYSVALWRMSNQSKDDIDNGDSSLGFNGEAMPLDEIASFHGVENSPTQLSWNKSKDNILLTSASKFTNWSVTESSAKQLSSLTFEDGLDVPIDINWSHGSSAWDPHSSNLCTCAFNTTVHLIDTRKMEITSKIPKAHSLTIRDVDYNPNKPLTIMTAGDDRKIKIWDLRNLQSPVQTLLGHSHWVWCSKYNPFHDQLLLSGGTDNVVNLWRIASTSSAPWLRADDLDESEEKKDPPDIKVRAMDQHEESVYGVAWSVSDAWIYASLSFDGRLIVNHVPSPEKYKILL